MNARLRPPAGCLVADPPWRHGDQLPGKGRGASKHYSTMTTREICEMPIPRLADDCWLWLWRLHTHQHDAFQVAEAWGFGTEPCSELVWVKTTKNGSILATNEDEALHLRDLGIKPRKVRMGMGHSLRMAHEVCLLIKPGKPERASAGTPSVIMAPRLEHSRKPAEFYRVVDEFVGSVHRVELFARRQWPNWTCLGNEMG